MEEFLYRESNDIHDAIAEGKEMTWPSQCRNCDFKFTQELKAEVYNMLRNNPSSDILYTISTCFRNKCKGYNYCCVNNYRPLINDTDEMTRTPGVLYHVFSKSLVIDDGLEEWQDVTWDGDEDQPTSSLVAVEENSLFDLIEGLEV